MPDNQLEGILADDNPIEINLFLAKNDAPDTLKTLLVRMLVYSFVQQQYEFHFRMREQTLFEDILADELVAAKAGLLVMGRKLGRANCAKALEQAIQQTVYRLSKKQAQNALIDMAYNFFQEVPANKKQKVDILTSREELIAKLLELLPKTVNPEE
jgi:pyruvate-formate lyase